MRLVIEENGESSSSCSKSAKQVLRVFATGMAVYAGIIFKHVFCDTVPSHSIPSGVRSPSSFNANESHAPSPSSANHSRVPSPSSPGGEGGIGPVVCDSLNAGSISGFLLVTGTVLFAACGWVFMRNAYSHCRKPCAIRKLANGQNALVFCPRNESEVHDDDGPAFSTIYDA